MRGRRRVAAAALLATAATVLPTVASAPAGAIVTNTPAVRMLIDTDLFSDADDVGALAVAFALQRRGEAKILGIGIDTRLDRPAIADASVGCAAAIAQFYGRRGVRIGAARPLHGTETNPVDFITPCAAKATSTPHVPAKVVPMYRRALAGQPDHSVVILSTGYLTNLAALLASSGDAISPMTGAQLIAAKVSRLIVMGGGYPSRVGENNFIGNPGAADQVAEHWPGTIVWDGYEVGDAIHTGQTISRTHPTSSPVRAAYEAFVGPNNWIYSYDLTAVYYAVRPGDPVMTLSTPGVNSVGANGSNRFDLDSGAHQYYLRLNDVNGLDASIEALLDAVPS